MRLIAVPATDSARLFLRPQPPRSRGEPIAARSLAAINPFRAAPRGSGLLGGLPGRQQNAQGFVDGLAAAGWLINFNWGDANAWESDWNANDDTYVDAADFVFYTGHADLNGWMLVTPGTSNLVRLTPSVAGRRPPIPVIAGDSGISNEWSSRHAGRSRTTYWRPAAEIF